MSCERVVWHGTGRLTALQQGQAAKAAREGEAAHAFMECARGHLARLKSAGWLPSDHVHALKRTFASLEALLSAGPGGPGGKGTWGGLPLWRLPQACLPSSSTPLPMPPL